MNSAQLNSTDSVTHTFYAYYLPMLSLLVYRERLVAKNMGLVFHTLKLFTKKYEEDGEHIDWDQYLSDGMLTLLDCARCFKPGRGVKFSTYTCNSLLKRFKRTKFKEDRKGLVNCGEKVASEFLPTHYSLNVDYSEGQNSGDNGYLIPDRLEEAEGELSELARQQDLIETLIAEAGLSDREEKLVRLRYLSKREKEYTLKELGEAISPKISKERVRQVLISAMQRLEVVARTYQQKRLNSVTRQDTRHKGYYQ